MWLNTHRTSFNFYPIENDKMSRNTRNTHHMEACPGAGSVNVLLRSNRNMLKGPRQRLRLPLTRTATGAMQRAALGIRVHVEVPGRKGCTLLQTAVTSQRITRVLWTRVTLREQVVRRNAHQSQGIVSWTAEKGRTWKTSPLVSVSPGRSRFSTETDRTSFSQLLQRLPSFSSTSRCDPC